MQDRLVAVTALVAVFSVAALVIIQSLFGLDTIAIAAQRDIPVEAPDNTIDFYLAVIAGVVAVILTQLRGMVAVLPRHIRSPWTQAALKRPSLSTSLGLILVKPASQLHH